MNPVTSLIRMKRMTRTLMFCVMLVNLDTFRIRKRDFHVKNSGFYISVAPKIFVFE